MADVDPKVARRELDRWARMTGYSDFDTYVAAGGSIGHAREDLDRRRHRLDLAMVGLYQYQAPVPPAPPEKHAEVTGDELLDDHERANTRMAIGPDALARAEAEVIGDPADPANIAIQGDDDER
jgi:hypothetical protein